MLSKTGILLIHGFGGNADEVNPLRSYLENRGYLVSCPELKGHTGIKRDLSQSNCSDWLMSAESALIDLKENCNLIVLIGFSMGGLIGLNLSTRHPLHAIVTLNTPIYYWDIPRIANNIYQDIRQSKTSYLRAYIKASLKYPLSSMVSFKSLLAKTKGILQQVGCPAFIAQGLLDDTVQHRSADFIYRSVSSKIKKLKYYQNANHLICYSPDKEMLFEDILGFIKNLSK